MPDHVRTLLLALLLASGCAAAPPPSPPVLAAHPNPALVRWLEDGNRKRTEFHREITGE